VTPDEIRHHATEIILDHARDVEFLSITEYLADHDLSDPGDHVAKAIDDLIGEATVTVEWACDRTDMPADPDAHCAGCGQRAGDHAAWTTPIAPQPVADTVAENGAAQPEHRHRFEPWRGEGCFAPNCPWDA
jgi:hypothetical protein